MTSLEELFEGLGLGEFLPAFRDEGFIQPVDVSELSDEDVKEIGKDMGMKRGHVVRLARWVREQRGTAQIPASTVEESAVTPGGQTAAAADGSALTIVGDLKKDGASSTAAAVPATDSSTAVPAAANPHARTPPAASLALNRLAIGQVCQVDHARSGGRGGVALASDVSPEGPYPATRAGGQPPAVRWCAGGCGWICADCVAVHEQHAGLFAGHELLLEPPPRPFWEDLNYDKDPDRCEVLTVDFNNPRLIKRDFKNWRKRLSEASR